VDRLGTDVGGVFKEFKEFLTDLSKEVFDGDRELWLANEKDELYPNHGSYATERRQQPGRASIILSCSFSANPIASIGTGSSEEYWATRCMRILVDVAFACSFLAEVCLSRSVASSCLRLYLFCSG